MNDAEATGKAIVGTASGQGRLDVVDLLRGLIMVIMALDHVRHFFHASSISPTNLSQTTVPLFFTRWITHFCAPNFILLAGVGISLGLSRAGSRWQHARYLLMRGLWLVVLENTLVRFGWTFSFQLTPLSGAVIWVIGWSMVVIAFLILLPDWMITAIGIILIVGHNALDGISPETFGSLEWFWRFLHVPGQTTFFSIPVRIGYPLVPWVGVMAAGFGFGKLLLQPVEIRSRKIQLIGLFMLIGFAVLRGSNLYGDTESWVKQSRPEMTLAAILNCRKYPPSLSYLLMTLGGTLTLWPYFERCRGPIARFMIVLGRVPLFYYVLHLPLIHGLALGVAAWRTGSEIPPISELITRYPRGVAGTEYGVSLTMVYFWWILVVFLLYPACLFYGRLRKRYPGGLLRFL